MTGTRRIAEIEPDWNVLWSLHRMRKDWSAKDTEEAIRAAKLANWAYEDIAREIWRLIWDPDGKPFELRNAARRAKAGSPTGPEVNARGRASVMAAIEEAQARRQAGPGERESA